MKNVIKHLFLLLIVIIFSSTSVLAQHNRYLHSHFRVTHELGFWLAGGLGGLEMSKNFGKTSNEIKPAGGVSYTYWFSNLVGVSTGAEYALHSTIFKASTFTDNFLSSPANPLTLRDYKEKLDYSMLSFPLMLQIQTTGYNTQLQFAMGGKIGLPMQGESKLQRVNYIYSPSATEKVEEVFSDGKSDIKYKISYMMAVELGLKFRMARASFFYIGGYLDYGMNNVQKKDDLKANTRVLNFAANKPVHNSVVNAIYAPKEIGKETAIITKINHINYGIKLRFSFSIGEERLTRNAYLREYLQDKYQDEQYAPRRSPHKDSDSEVPDESGDHTDGYYYYD